MNWNRSYVSLAWFDSIARLYGDKTPFNIMETTKKAVNQQAKVNVNGNDVPLFGSLESKVLAVVDLNVLKRITAYLPNTSFGEIRNSFMREVDLTKGMKQFIECLENELRFHKSVNEINVFDAEELKEELQPVEVSSKVVAG